MTRLWHPTNKKGLAQSLRTRWLDVERCKRSGEKYIDAVDFQIRWTEDDRAANYLNESREMNIHVDVEMLLYALQEMYPELEITFSPDTPDLMDVRDSMERR